MANGHRDNVLGIAPTTATAPTWAPFSFPGHFHAGAVIRFAEDTTQLRRVLPHGWMQRPCRWEFGDSERWASGWTATHRYARPGIYRITVAAYVPAYRAYYPFDTVRIVVTR